MGKFVRLKPLAGSYAISQLASSAQIPAWADGDGFVSISRTEDELSIVCLEDRVPLGIRTDGGWSAFKLEGPFAFDETGVLLSVIEPLSANGIGIFAVSTFDTDYLLVKTADATKACALLGAAGHSFV
ncbi:ACT domain-containing protein [Pleomorphomonas oryzae]|uniref:ACT domain-containing protein n=1 Tax=Pleomorphomonas oryzae TaxID=261934 RepID=UPI000423B6B9|nr:ACT domain-containing protein [Pleomorphomonas oryzae]